MNRYLVRGYGVFNVYGILVEHTDMEGAFTKGKVELIEKHPDVIIKSWCIDKEQEDDDFAVLAFCPFCYYPQGHSATCKLSKSNLTRKTEWLIFFKEKEDV